MVSGTRDIRGKNYPDTGYLREKLLGYRILRKIVTYQMFDEKRFWITKTFGIAAIDNHVNVQ